MRYKMIFGQTLFSFFRKDRQDLRIKEVRFMNRNADGEVNGTTRLLYDEDAGVLQRYVNGSAPIASLSDEMVCFLSEVSRCFGRLSGDMSWEKDVWLCVDTEVLLEKTYCGDDEKEQEKAEGACGLLPLISESNTGEQAGCYRAGF